jgi:hypothetical protein
MKQFRVRRRLLLESFVLAGLLVGIAFLALLGEPQNPDFGTRAILIAGLGLPWLVLNSVPASRPAIVETSLLLAMCLAHFALLVALFYAAGVAFESWKQRRTHARA